MSKHKIPKETYKPDFIGEVDRDISWLLIIFIGIMPLLVRFKVIDFIAPKIVSKFLNTGLQFDSFSYYKWVFLICVAVIAVILILYKMLAFNYVLRKSYINIPLCLLIFFVLLSLLSSEFKSIALVGLYNQHEGALTYLAFFAIFFVAANAVFKDWFAKYITIALGIFAVINSIIVLFCFFGHDMLYNPVILSLIIPSNMQEYVKGTLNSTLSNPNYVSGLAAALFTYFLAFALLEKRLKDILLYVFFALVSFVLMLASLSSSGYVSLLIISPIIISMVLLYRGKKYMVTVIGSTLALCLAVFLLLNIYNPLIFDETVGFVKQIVPRHELIKQPEQLQNEFYLPAPAMSAGSGRVYIWSETFKLIKNKPLLGYGQDTLAYYFPQNDRNKITGMGTYDVLISKPHNMYLAIAYGSGIPALLAMLSLFLVHFYHTGLHLLKAERDEKIIFPAALFLFFCTFIIQWLFNDSVIGSSAIFWALLGVAVSLNINTESLAKSK